MSSRPSFRTSSSWSSSLRAGALSVAAVVVVSALPACGNIGLESSAPASGSPGGGYGDQDATGAFQSDGSANVPAPGAADAAATPTRGSALCNWAYVSGGDGTIRCYPDDPPTDANYRCHESTTWDASDGGATLACHVVAAPGGDVTQACTAAGTGEDGAPCLTGEGCAPTFECVGTPGVCRRYCCDGDKSCGAMKGAERSFCDIATTTEGALSVPVCQPVTTCKLLMTNACPDGSTCAVVKDDGTTSCVATGPQQAGDACDRAHCAAGLTCLGKTDARRCYKICRLGMPADCPADQKCKGSAQLFSDPQFGLCQ